jgi:hypothetical protein
MMRAATVLAAMLASFPAVAQYQYDLATTRDGSVLYFSQVVSAIDLSTRIYRWSPETGVTLFADRADVAQAPPLPGQHLYGTAVTDDGTVLYHAEPLCSTGTGPGFNNCTVGETFIVTPGHEQFSVPGFLLISPNGRYGVFTPYGKGGLWVDWWTGEEIEVDFQGRTIPNLSQPFWVNQHAIADNGSFLIDAAGAPGLRIWSKTGEIVLPLFDYIERASISADGGTVAVTAHDTREGPTSPTYVYDLASGRRTKFAMPVSMSADGQTVAYLSADVNQPPFENARAVVARSDGTGAVLVTSTLEGVRSVLISPDARYLYVVIGNWYVSTSSQIERYDLSTGAIDRITAVP